ncbi:hypothetical protein V6N12_040881 [Hibiscus sabdariffa]|uniref:P-loop containing nucleoside triphosphate hydrolases superfamily protein n=1 Tax=Hibiscus sabdariffa TaxID=183260 RepID=A0ABR2E4Z0_9ROSI
MDGSAEKRGPEVVMTVNSADQRERSNAPRRWVQTTLMFPHISSETEPKVDRRGNEGDEVYNDDEDGDFSCSQGKRRGRKRKGKGTHQNRASKKAKEKSPGKTTPKKKGMNNLIESGDASPSPIPNLKAMEKLTAEKSLQMVAGRKIHPLFASQKKLLGRSKKSISIGPIHVFERTQDDVVIDWKDWTIFEKTSIDTGCNPEGLFTSKFESNVGALCLDNFPGILSFSDSSFVRNKLSGQCINQDNDKLGMSLDELLDNNQLSKSSEGADILENSEPKHQRRLLQEGFVPSYHGCTIQPDNSLWADNYQPKSATEVCGNTESVKFMNEWLHLWRKRRSLSIKASDNIDNRNLQEDDEDFCESESDDDENRLKNILLVTGPIGDLADFKLAYVRPLSYSETVKEFDNEVIDLILMSDEEDSFGANGVSGKCDCDDSETDFDLDKLKPLILFEDVDISFPKDHGYIAAIQKIAKTAKWPMILTSNNNNLVLPNNLDRLELCFMMPSQEELLDHLTMVRQYALRRVHEKSRNKMKDLQYVSQQYRKSQNTYGLLLVDLETYHSVLPAIIPWDFPSQLSELVEKEIAKTLSMIEENSTLMEVMDEEFQNNMSKGLEVHNNEVHSIEAKEVMLSSNISRRTRKRKLDDIMSSDSKDGNFNKQLSLVSDKNVHHELFIKEDRRHLSHCPNMQNCTRTLTDKLLCSEIDKCEDRGFQCSETENNLQTDTGNCIDVCVPYIPATEIVNGMELFSRSVSRVNVAEATEVSVSGEFREDPLPVEEHKLVKTSDMLGGTCSITAGASLEEVVVNSQNEYDEVVSRGHPVMVDKCNCENFKRKSFSLGKFTNQVATDLVQESWEKLRGSHAELKLYVGSETKDVFKILKQTSRMSDLLSQADQLLSKWQVQDSLEMLMMPSENSVSVTWCDEQLQMATTISKHGFCLYAKEIDSIVSILGFEHRVDFGQETLAPSTITMALGRLLGHDAGTSWTSVYGKGSEISLSKCELPVKRSLGWMT